MDEKRFANILKQYTNRYEIRFCGEKEQLRLREFIDRYWRKNHVLASSEELLDWQYLDKKNHRYNFVMAIEKKTDEIHGILGFIPTNIFDPGIKTPMRWGAVWKIREDVASRGLGLAMKMYMYQNAKAPYAGGIGLSRFSREINRKMGEEVGVMKHFYIINPDMKDFALADHVERENKKSCGILNHNIHFEECGKSDFENGQEEFFKELLPYKSGMYYIKRFFEHPFYKYQCIKVVDEKEKSSAAFFIRICRNGSAKCIMIVDFLGKEEALTGAEGCFQKLLADYNAEYISFYEYGLNGESLRRAGFKERQESEIVIPLYYEPFERVNADIDFHYYNDGTVEKKPYFFKGDADQDRPNILPV